MGTHKHIHRNPTLDQFLGKFPVVVVPRHKNLLFLVRVKVLGVISRHMSSRAFVVQSRNEGQDSSPCFKQKGFGSQQTLAETELRVQGFGVGFIMELLKGIEKSVNSVSLALEIKHQFGGRDWDEAVLLVHARIHTDFVVFDLEAVHVNIYCQNGDMSIFLVGH